MGGQQNQAFTSTATQRGVCIAMDGAMRVSFVEGRFFVFKKLDDGALDEWLAERRLPIVGGTIPTMSNEQMKEAYPYLGKDAKRGGSSIPSEAGKDGWFKNPFG